MADKCFKWACNTYMDEARETYLQLAQFWLDVASKLDGPPDRNKYECEPGRRSAAKLLSKDEARRIAANIAKLPALLQKPSGPTQN